MADDFQFVTLSHPSEVKDKQNQRLIRRHAIRGGMRRERLRAASRRKSDTSEPRREPSLGKLDPFDSLPQCPERLRALMRHKNARQAGEPIFCVGEVKPSFFQGLETIFHGALADEALFHSLSLCLALAANEGRVNVECLTHRGKAMKELGKRLAVCNEGSIIQTSTFSAILLLIGYEYRVEGANAQSVSVHLKAIDELIRLWNSANVFFCDTIRRALFWQDLMSSFLVGTKRLLSHEKFPELTWIRDPYRESFYIVPPGFNSILAQLPAEMMEILEDLNALSTLLEARCMCGSLPINQIQIDNGQAWLESRLVNLLLHLRNSRNSDSALEACIFATYACAYKLSTGIWESSLIPEFCAKQILRKMQESEADCEWQKHPALVLWLLFVGGSIAGKRVLRLQFTALILGSYRGRIAELHSTWPMAQQMLQRFVWCSHLCASFRTFWEEVHPT